MTREQAQRMRELVMCPLVRCYPTERVQPYALRDQLRSAPARAKYKLLQALCEQEGSRTQSPRLDPG